MNSIAIQARGLNKTYRLYSRPHYKILDLFGLLPKGTGRYSEHPALQDFDISIGKGEKVAVIGRNGAGKSTFLKLVSNVIEPTKGKIDVNGEVHALLSIGSGFHPDLTGRENVSNYLGNRGIYGKQTEALTNSIIEFAEIEEYIDQPIKSYSTGMGVRLMFAASTAVIPDILVLDEVLSVGDAYFAQKSAERIHAMCEKSGTTLLFVTHDLYSAIELCDRCIWLDNGVTVMDGAPPAVVNRYEASIRDQQEKRLRKNTVAALEENTEQPAKDRVVLFGQIRCNGNVPVDAPVPVKALRFYDGDTLLQTLEPGTIPDETQPDDARLPSVVLEQGQGNWGKCVLDGDDRVRCFMPEGSIYHRAAFLLCGEELEAALAQGRLHVEIEYKDMASTPCQIEIFHPGGDERSRASLGNSASGKWRKDRIAIGSKATLEKDVPELYRYGNQRFSITGVEFLDGRGEEAHIFETGASMSIRLGYEIRDPAFCQRPIINVNFLRDGVTRSHRFVLENHLFDAASERRGVLEITASPLLVCKGTYLVNVAAMAEGGYDGKTFFTANENLLDHHSRAYQIEVVESGNHLVDDCVFIHPATWKKQGKVVQTGAYPFQQPGA